jgi:hypothetical protein
VKHVLTIVAVVCWLGMVTLLVRKQTPLPALELDALPVADERPREDWFGVYQGERKIGHTHRVLTQTENGWMIRDETRLALAMLGTPQPVTTSLVAEMDPAFALRRFNFTLESAAASFAATGNADAERLHVTYGPKGQGKEVVLPLTEPIYLPSAVRPRLIAARPEPGARFTYTVFNPLTLAHQSIAVTVEGRETIPGPDGPVETLRVSEEHDGLSARAWLDADGGAVREEGMLGLVLRREAQTVAVAGVQTDAPIDLTIAARIPLAGVIDDPRDAAALTLRVTGDAAGRIPTDAPRQQVHDGLLRIVREAPPPAEAPPGPSALAAYVKPGAFIESDDTEIVATAKQAVGGETDRAGRARKLVAWVHENMTQEPALTMPSAREVLRTRRGDCNEHAVLLTALARAAGIPARVAAGVVYAGDGFYYHAWTEFWLGRWVSADAIFDQMPADATHVKLLDGGPERHFELAGVMGKLAFATVEEGS